MRKCRLTKAEQVMWFSFFDKTPLGELMMLRREQQSEGSISLRRSDFAHLAQIGDKRAEALTTISWGPDGETFLWWATIAQRLREGESPRILSEEFGIAEILERELAALEPPPLPRDLSPRWSGVRPIRLGRKARCS